MKCFVGISQEYASNQSGLNPNIPANEFNNPLARLMDCEEYHRIYQENKEKSVQHLEKTFDNLVHPAGKQCIRGIIEFLKTMQFCKNDCRYCAKSTAEKFSNKPTEFACAGPPEMGLFKDFPHNECKVVGPKDIAVNLPECDPSKFEISDTLPPIARFDLPNIQGEDISNEPKKICTCSNDGCNNPAGSGQPIPPSGDGTHPTGDGNPKPPSGDDTQSGVNPKPTPDDDTDQKDNSCHPETLDFLLILALVVAFRFD